MTYGYIRVSSDKQTVENQRYEIEEFCKREFVHIDKWIEETISGTCNYTQRKLGRLIKRCRSGDTIICSELSRLGRKMYMIMEILSICSTRGCQVWTIKDGFRLGDNVQSKTLAFAFGIAAEIERNLISQRTREALAQRRAMGKKLGRPSGRGHQPKSDRLVDATQLIVHLRRQGSSISEIARKMKCSKSTMARFLKNLNFDVSYTDGPI